MTMISDLTRVLIALARSEKQPQAVADLRWATAVVMYADLIEAHRLDPHVATENQLACIDSLIRPVRS